MTAALEPLYERLAEHYRAAIRAGTLGVGQRLPSVRTLVSQHGVSLSTALQALRHLEDQGWLEARPRSGYYVREPLRRAMPPATELGQDERPDAAAYVGINERVSQILARGQLADVRVNLALAVGAPALYPGEELRRAMQRQLRLQPQILTTMARRHGHPALRQVLAQRALARGIQVAPQEVTVTHGCIEAINLALRAVARPGDTVAVESPTFYGLLQVLESLGLRALEIPTSPTTGLSLEALEFALQQPGAAEIKAVVAMPTFQNPLGCVMPDAHKQRLVQLCVQHDIALIEDDIYGDLGDSDTPYRAAKAYDRSGQVIYCHSLNKLVAPGLRLGWMLAGRWQARVEMLKYTQSRYGEELPQIVVAEMLAGAGYTRHLARLRQTLRRQRQQMAEAVAAHFPEGTRLSVPAGGLLLWLQMPEAVSGDAVFEAALRQGIKLAPGSMFSNGPRYRNCLRLSCGQPHDEAVRQALRRVGEIVTEIAAPAT